MIGFCRVWSCVTWLGTMGCFQNEALVAHVLGFGCLVQYGKECGTFVQSSCGLKGVFYHGLCVIIYAGRIVPCLHWHLIRVIGRMTSLEWFSIWETSNNIINFNDVRKRLWKLVSMMMFSPCVFCVLPCVTSTFTVSKLARIIKQASRVGGCERVFTPVRWRQVRLSCIKWRSTFFLYFFVRPSFGRQFVIRVDGCCANCVVGLAFLPSGHTTRKQRHYDAITTSCARWVG